MKSRNLIYTGLLAGLLAGGCKRDMDSLFQNPETFTSTKIEYFLPTAIDATVRQDYAGAYNNYFRLLGPMLQITASTVDPVSGGYYRITSDRGEWNSYFLTRMINVKAIENQFKYRLTAGEQEAYNVYYWISKILGAYTTAQATDLFDDIPYSQGFAAHNSLYGQPVNYYPEYDSQQSIYDAVLRDLKDAAAYLAGATLQPTMLESHRALPVQDILFKGDLQKWVKLANSLRLRYAMRISGADEARAKQELADILQNNHPLILTNADNAELFVGNQTFGGASNTILRALNENNNNQYAPGFMVDQMKTAGDPRLPLFFYQSKDTGTIVGLPATFAARTFDITRAAVIDSVTFVRNTALPTGTAITAADVNFLLAEARHRGLITTGAAKDYYEAGIRASISSYFNLYIASPAPRKKPELNRQPDATAVNALLSSSAYAFNPAQALEQIALQKWIHTGFMQMNENYAEFRRLDLPLLPADIYDGQQQNGKYPVRYLYPASEAANNSSNFQKVSSKNTMESKVWWDVK